MGVQCHIAVLSYRQLESFLHSQPSHWKFKSDLIFAHIYVIKFDLFLIFDCKLWGTDSLRG